MLPNKILLNVFNWLDRRFLETTLRLVSRRTDALIVRDKSGPLLYIDRLDITLSTAVQFSIHHKFKKENSNFVDSKPPVRKPFRILNAESIAKIPSYLYIRQTIIKKDSWLSMTLKSYIRPEHEGYLRHKAEYTRKEIESDDVTYYSDGGVYFYVSVEPGADESILFDRAWGQRFMAASINFRPENLTLLKSKVFCWAADIQLYLKELRADDVTWIGPLASWVTAPVAGATWNWRRSKGGRPIVRHVALYYVSMPVAEQLYNAVREIFKTSKNPIHFHLTIFMELDDQFNQQIAAEVFRWRLLRKAMTRQTLHAEYDNVYGVVNMWSDWTARSQSDPSRCSIILDYDETCDIFT